MAGRAITAASGDSRIWRIRRKDTAATQSNNVMPGRTEYKNACEWHAQQSL
jgi:hypothetical protein